MPTEKAGFTSAARGSGEAHGIIRGAALCALCRYRHNAHWTAKADRCNRELGKRFGDNAYSIEELVAELTAAFTMAHLGLSSEPRPDHAQYIASWLKVLKADNRAVFTAASKAQQAADYIIRESGRTAEVAA